MSTDLTLEVMIDGILILRTSSCVLPVQQFTFLCGYIKLRLFFLHFLISNFIDNRCHMTQSCYSSCSIQLNLATVVAPFNQCLNTMYIKCKKAFANVMTKTPRQKKIRIEYILLSVPDKD